MGASDAVVAVEMLKSFSAPDMDKSPLVLDSLFSDAVVAECFFPRPRGRAHTSTTTATTASEDFTLEKSPLSLSASLQHLYSNWAYTGITYNDKEGRTWQSVTISGSGSGVSRCLRRSQRMAKFVFSPIVWSSRRLVGWSSRRIGLLKGNTQPNGCPISGLPPASGFPFTSRTRSIPALWPSHTGRAKSCVSSLLVGVGGAA